MSRYPVHAPSLLGYGISKTCSLLWDQCKSKHDICDVTINLQGEESIKAHWCVLLQCPYFAALYESGLQEKATAELRLDLVSEDIALMALEFIYKQALDVRKDQFGDLIKVADYLQLDSLKEGLISCTERFVIIDDCNCLEFLSLGEMYDIEKLVVKAQTVLQTNFEKVTQGSEILKTSAEYLLALLKNKTLKRMPAETFFDLVVRWVELGEERKKDFPRLFAALDLKDIASDGLEKIKENKYVKQNAKCKKLVANHYKLIKGGKLDLTDNTKDVILIIGEQDRDKDEKIHCLAYVIDDNHWTRFAYAPQFRYGAKCDYNPVGVVHGKAYLNGSLISELFPFMGLFDEDDSNQSLRLVQLWPENVKRKWYDVSFNNAEYTLEDVYCIGEMTDGGMASITTDSEGKLRLKIDLSSYVEWFNEQAQTNPDTFTVPDSQKTSTSYDLVKFLPPKVGIMPRILRGCFVVCNKDVVFVYLSFAQALMETEHCLLFDIKKKAISDCSPKTVVQKPDIIFIDGNRVYLETYGHGTRAFSLKSKAWEALSSKEKVPSMRKKPTEYCLVRHKNDKYLFTLSGKKKTSLNTLYKLNKSNTWDEISSLSLSPGLTRFSGVAMKVNKFKLCCPMDCQECDNVLFQNWNELYHGLYTRKDNMMEPHVVDKKTK